MAVSKHEAAGHRNSVGRNSEAHCLHAAVSSLRRMNLSVTQNFNRVRRHSGKREVAKEFGRAGRNRFVKGAFKDQASDVLSPFIKPFVFRAISEVAHAEPSPCAGDMRRVQPKLEQLTRHRKGRGAT